MQPGEEIHFDKKKYGGNLRIEGPPNSEARKEL
jgi:hypothetical protein